MQKSSCHLSKSRGLNQFESNQRDKVYSYVEKNNEKYFALPFHLCLFNTLDIFYTFKKVKIEKNNLL